MNHNPGSALDWEKPKFPLFKYVPAEVLRLILCTRKLRWSSPLKFNDPFDVRRGIDFGIPIDDLKVLLLREYDNILFGAEEPKIAPGWPLEPWIQPVRRALGNTELREEYRRNLPNLIDIEGMKRRVEQYTNQWQLTLRRFRILSLTDNKDSPMMWDRYAKGFTGAVIALQAIKAKDSAWLATRKVEYCENHWAIMSPEGWVKYLTGQKPITIDDMVSPTFFKKSPEWQHESEWRALTFREEEEPLYSDFPLLPEEVQAVYLGFRMEHSVRNEVLDIIDSEFPCTEVQVVTPSSSQPALNYEIIRPGCEPRVKDSE